MESQARESSTFRTPTAIICDGHDVQAMAVILSSLLVMGSVFARLGAEIEEQEGAGISMLQTSDIETQLSDRVVHDEQELALDVSRQQQYLKSVAAGKKGSMLVSYADGCSCSCPASGCDEEKHQGPVRCHACCGIFALNK